MKWLWIIVIALAAAAAVFYGYVSSFFFRYAVSRRGVPQRRNAKQPPEWERVQGQLEEGRRYFFSRKSEDVYIDSYDGLKLHGYWFETPGAKRVILCVHGFRGSPDGDFGTALSFYLGNGCSVLAIDQRAHSKSEGKYLCFGEKERYDCQRWAEYAVRLAPELPLYIHGVSMGCATVLMAAGLPLPEHTAAFIADCGYTRPWEEFCYVLKHDFHMAKFPVMQIERFLCKMIAGFDIKGYSTLDAMRTNRLPVLFVHGGADTFVPTGMSRENYAACAAEKQLLIIDEAVHAQSWLVARERCAAALSAWFEKYDKKEV